MKKNLFILVAFVALFATSCKKQQSKEFVFTPMECDTIEFVIEGLLSEGAHNLFIQELSSSEKTQTEKENSIIIISTTDIIFFFIFIFLL